MKVVLLALCPSPGHVEVTPTLPRLLAPSPAGGLGSLCSPPASHGVGGAREECHSHPAPWMGTEDFPVPPTQDLAGATKLGALCGRVLVAAPGPLSAAQALWCQ